MIAQKNLSFFLLITFGCHFCFGNTYQPGGVMVGGYLSPGRSSSTSIVKQIAGAVSFVITGFLSIFGDSDNSHNSRKSNSYKKKGRCNCGRSDCPNSKKEPLSPVQQLYNQIPECNYPIDNGSTIACQNSASYTSPAKPATSPVQPTPKKPQKTEQQKRKEREEKERIQFEQNQIFTAQEVQPIFIEKIEEIEDTATFFYNSSTSSGLERCSRQEQRRESIHKALDNNFYVEYKRYNLTDHTQQLLTKHQIDIHIFEHCAGNAIQQQIHAEFVTVLNSGADLHKSENVQHLTENWFSTLGGYSAVGSNVNSAGQFSLAHTISDICNGLFEIAKNGAYAQYQDEILDYEVDQQIISATVHYFKKVFTFPGEVAQDIKYAAKRVGGAISDFMPGVKKKALRPVCSVAQFCHEFKNNPVIAYKKASKFVFERAEEFLNTNPMLRAMSTSSNYCRSKNTTQFLIDEFEKGYALPFQKQIEAAAHTFWQMPRKEKAQELVALGAQVITVIAAVQLTTAMATAAAAQVSLAKAAILLNLEKFFRVAEPVMRTGISPGGGATFAVELAEPLSEEFIVVLEEAAAIATSGSAVVVSPAAVDVACNTLFALSENVSGASGVESVGSSGGQSTPPLPPDDEIQRRIAENIRAIQEMEKKGIEISPEYRRLALEGNKLLKGGRAVDAGITHPYMTDQEAEKLRTLFIKEMGGKETLKKLGLEDAVIDKRFIKHIMSPEIKTMVTRAGKVSNKLSGCHFIDKELVKNGSLRYEIIKDGSVKKVQVYCYGVFDKKTIFPIEWTKKQAITEIGRSIKQFANALAEKPVKLLGELKTSIGPIDIMTVVDESNRFTTSFPSLKGA